MTETNPGPASGGPHVAASPSEAPRRRAEDATVMLFGGNRSAAEGITANLGTFDPTPEQLANAAFLIDLGTDDALVVPAADAHLLPRGEGGEELQGRAMAMAQALRRERDWLMRRLRMPDFLLGYAESLQRAATEADVYEALREVATPVVGAYTAVVFLPVEDGADSAFHALADPALRLALAPLPPETVMQFAEQRLVTLAEVSAEPAGVLAPLSAMFDAAGVTQLLCAPVGADGLLVLLERRRDRVLTGEDRDLLTALVRQAEAALRRIVSERQVAALELADPITGLPAGRHVEIIVDHALAMARRGQPLTLMMIDLDAADAAPQLADSEDALFWLATSLKEQLRRTDLAVRHGGNRFLVLLADTNASGAQAVVRRIEEQAAGSVRLSAGIAVYGPEADTAERLASVAAEDLKGRKRDPEP